MTRINDRGILSPDLLRAGFSKYSNVNGQPCLLSPDASELEHRERGAFGMGGCDAHEHRRNLYKWVTYRKKKVRQKVVKALQTMADIEVPDKIDNQQAKGFSFGFDLNNPDDLEVLATALHADLMRLAKTKRQIAKYADGKSGAVQ
jgi:hypothetical protein